MAADYKYRGQGTRTRDEDRLRARYDAAVVGKPRRPEWVVTPPSLAEATGDQLAENDAELAAHAYGLADAPRPAVKLRNIRAEAFGDELSGITDMAIWFQDSRRWSALRSADEAIALAAERNTWIGTRAPASFDRALELVRKSVGRARKLGRLRYGSHGWTGRSLFAIPAPGMVVRMPVPHPVRTNLPLEGALVPDDAFWRRRVRDVVLLYEGDAGKTPNLAAGRDGMIALMGKANRGRPEVQDEHPRPASLGLPPLRSTRPRYPPRRHPGSKALGRTEAPRRTALILSAGLAGTCHDVQGRYGGLATYPMPSATVS